MTYFVSKVRKERIANGTHDHIAGVCTTSGQYFTRAQVVASINNRDEWKTLTAGGRSALIRPIRECWGCHATPYITTRPDNYKDDNLESLPPC